MEAKNKKELQDIVYESKADIYCYFFITAILLLIALLLMFFKIDWFYLLLFLDLLLFFASITKIIVYWRVLKITKYLEHNKLVDKIGKIDFWDDDHYLLCDNYMVIVVANKVQCFSYDEIKEIYKKNKFNIGKNSYYQQYLCLVLENWEEIEILIYSTLLVNENFRDITDYLLSKNKNINIIE